jgi:hypothetical protein
MVFEGIGPPESGFNVWILKAWAFDGLKRPDCYPIELVYFCIAESAPRKRLQGMDFNGF